MNAGTGSSGRPRSTASASGRQKSGNGSSPHEPELLLDLYRQMYLIRQFEQACAENYTRGLVRGFLHLYSGEEAIAVGVLSALRGDDIVVTHYRDHGHALARGLDPQRVMAELFGRASGVSGGKGGSMHLFDASRHFMGGHAIVGAQLPLAAGLAFSLKYRNEDRLAVVFFGDGAVSQGTFHETMNLASLWKLPLLFLLENNLYGMGTPVELTRAGGQDIYTSAQAYGIEGVLVDGMDVLAVRDVTREAAERVRAGHGPAFIEAKTFRFEGHSIADPARYRDQGEVEGWQQRDPLITFPKLLLDLRVLTEHDLDAIHEDVDAVVAAAVKFAEESPPPEPQALLRDIYA